MRMFFLTILILFVLQVTSSVEASNRVFASCDTLINVEKEGMISFYLYANPGFIIEGDSTKIFAFVENAIPDMTFDWYPKDCVSKSDSSTVFAFPKETTNIYLTITSGSQSVTDSINVKVLSTPRGFSVNVIDNDVYLEWDKVETAEFYIVRRNDETIVNYIESTSFVDKDVAEGNYCYTVISVRYANISPEAERECVELLTLSEYNETEIDIYPNPTRKEINIQADQLKSVFLYNVFGQMILSESVECDNISVDLSELESSVYLLEVETEVETFTRKIYLIK